MQTRCIAIGLALFLMSSFALAQEPGFPGPQLVSSLGREGYRFMLITTYTVPQAGGERTRFRQHVDTYFWPRFRDDPNVLSYRVAFHNIGSNQPNIWIITEYESLIALDKSSMFGHQWFEEHYPPDSEERAAYDKSNSENYVPYYDGHSEEILRINTARMK